MATASIPPLCSGVSGFPKIRPGCFVAHLVGILFQVEEMRRSAQDIHYQLSPSTTKSISRPPGLLTLGIMVFSRIVIA
jgi:hypothetical protein